VTAQRIGTDAEAIAAAAALAAEFARGAQARDRNRHLPHAEVARMAKAGLWAVTVPRRFGGAGVSAGTLAEVIAILSAADGSIGQIPQNHCYILEALRLDGSEAQQHDWYGRVLEGGRFAQLRRPSGHWFGPCSLAQGGVPGPGGTGVRSGPISSCSRQSASPRVRSQPGRV
jgi:hypothetical protein